MEISWTVLEKKVCFNYLIGGGHQLTCFEALVILLFVNMQFALYWICLRTKTMQHANVRVHLCMYVIYARDVNDRTSVRDVRKASIQMCIQKMHLYAASSWFRVGWYMFVCVSVAWFSINMVKYYVWDENCIIIININKHSTVLFYTAEKIYNE